MKSLLRTIASSLLLATAALIHLPSHAATYSSLYVFGDSLSDTGNLFIATGGALPPAGQPYFNGRFSNGPLWVETLAAGLGLAADAAPSLAGGNNYAFAGARTDTSSTPPGILAQLGGLWAPAHPTADPDALYVVAGGGNDMRDARSAASTDASRQAAAAAAVGNLFNSVALLASSGAKHVLISNLADLGGTPEAALLGLVANSTDVTLRFNALVTTLEAALEGLFTGLDVVMLDMYGLNEAIRNDALNNGGAVYGITNVVAPCAGFTFSLGVPCDVSLFSDALHPSARAHRLLGDAALKLVPVPGTAVLLISGILIAVQLRRRGQA
jgi:outer membrane lipase/esterase